jgi:hypothetical protein
MPDIKLSVAYDDTLHVYDGEDLIGEITPSSNYEEPGDDAIWWAAYRANDGGYIVERRIGTYPTIARALEALL